jgi:acyl-CoA thioesterase-1
VIPDIRICFVGDSFVNGTGDETALGWVGRLCAAANKLASVTYYNLGIRRDTSRDILLRWERKCALRLPEGCDGRVVISCGVNDTAIANGQLRVPQGESSANIREILRGARKYKVLMVGPPPIGEADQDTRIHALSAAFSREAEGFGVPYIDLFSSLALDDAYMREVVANDGAHPSSIGYAKMARIIGASPSWWFSAP